MCGRGRSTPSPPPTGCRSRATSASSGGSTREHAADLTQEFFARTLENDSAGAVRPGARPLPHLRAAARRRLRVECPQGGPAAEARRRVREAVPLEETLPDGQCASHEPPVTDDHDEAFYREWVRALFEGAVDDLRAEAQARGRDVQFEVFRRYDLADMRDEAQPSYAEIATALGLTVATVTNHLAAMRRAAAGPRARPAARADRQRRGVRGRGQAPARDPAMTGLDDGAVARLRAAADVPDLGDRYEVRGADWAWRIERGLCRLRPGTGREVAVKVADAYAADAAASTRLHARSPYPRRPRASRASCRCTTPASPPTAAPSTS